MSTTMLLSPHEKAINKGYEVIHGEIIEVPPMGFFAVSLATVLTRLLDQAGMESRVGRAFTEGLFRLDALENLQRRPDVAFVSRVRMDEAGVRLHAEEDPSFLDVVPSIAVEVVSPSNLAIEMEEKRNDYLRCGVEQVWLIYPSTKSILVFHQSGHCEALDETKFLTGETLLPNFRIQVQDLFRAAEY
jgi:Uma2 family endonuclease